VRTVVAIVTGRSPRPRRIRAGSSDAATGRHELQLGPCAARASTDAAIGGRLCATSLARLPGSRATTGRSGSRPSSRRSVTGSAGGWTRTHERMPHEAHRHARIPIERLLEGKDDEHARDGRADVVDTASPPGPELGRNVVDDGDPAAMERPSQPQVEVRIIHQHGGVGPVALGLLQDRAGRPPGDAEVRDDLEQADDGEVADVGQQRGALRLQPVAPEARTRRGPAPARAGGGRARRRTDRPKLRRTR
jgi:hypothetical protein